MRTPAIAFAAFTLILMAQFAASGRTAMADDSSARLRAMTDALPAVIDSWQKADTCEIYTPDDLYRYINGGAELYISYRFAAMASQPYSKGDDEIRLDIFDMGSGPGAYGVFVHSAEDVDRFLAQDVDSEYAGGLLTFWKGRYYGSVLAYPENDEKQRLVRELGRAVAAQIDEVHEVPALVSYLPVEDLLPHSVRYFLHHAWVNDHRFFADENLLNIEAGVEAAMARYRPRGNQEKPFVLLVVAYPDIKTARSGLARFESALLADSTDGWLQQDDGTWLGCRRADNLVIIVADAADRDSAAEMMASCARRHGLD